MANFIFVKETFNEGKELGFYEGIELKYGENAFKTLDEARSFAFEAVHGMGLHATVYDYDKELDEYLEFYSL
jgi:hypothetical protein